jgi:hypothetical protein
MAALSATPKIRLLITFVARQRAHAPAFLSPSRSDTFVSQTWNQNVTLHGTRFQKGVYLIDI